jgi:hypothetical protein
MMRTPLRVTVIAAVAASAFALTGCGSDDPEAPATSVTPTASPTMSTTAPSSPSSSATPTESETPTSTPSSTPSASADAGEKLGIGCDDLVSAQQIYEYNANFSIDEDYSPGSGSRAATIADYNGLTCSWVNDSSHERITVGVAKLKPATIDTIENQRADASTATDFGYFTVSGTTGQADAFEDDTYWIIADSKIFFESGDAAQIIDYVEDSLD